MLAGMTEASYAQAVPPTGPGCAVNPSSPSIGADVPETYFGPEPSSVQKELVGRLQLLTAGKLDDRAGTIASTVTLRLAPGFSFARPVLYLSTDASTEMVAALEEATFAPGLQDIEVGDDDSAFSAVERIFVALNGPRDCNNPQRQGIEARFWTAGARLMCWAESRQSPRITALCGT